MARFFPVSEPITAGDEDDITINIQDGDGNPVDLSDYSDPILGIVEQRKFDAGGFSRPASRPR